MVNSQQLCGVEPPAQAGIPGAVTPEDVAQSQRFFRPLRRRQFLAGRGQLRETLQAATGIDGQAWRLVPDRFGRPQAFAPDGRPGPDVSVSHSGDRIVVALVTEGRIGVDIELIRPGRAVEAFAQIVLSSDERAQVVAGGQSVFLRFWTLREAIGKAGGEGMEAALQAEGQALAGLGEHPSLVGLAGQPWVLGQRAVADGSMALAWRFDEARLDGAEAVACVARALDEAAAAAYVREL